MTTKKTDSYALPDKAYKLPLSDALFCAMDGTRNRAFYAAIQNSLQQLSGQTEKVQVLYAGSGTGILGFFALALGANHCTFLEHNPYSLAYSQELARTLGYSAQINFLECDATKVVLSQKYDLLISETLTSGFVNEDFPKIVNHLKEFGTERLRILPEKFFITMEEHATNDDLLATREFVFISKDDFLQQKIHLQNLLTTKIIWKTISVLSGDITLRSGDCISYLNPLSQSVENFTHPLFTLIPAKGSKKETIISP